MVLKTGTKAIRWWFRASMLAFIVPAVAGCTPACYVVMAIGGLQVLFFPAQ